MKNSMGTSHRETSLHRSEQGIVSIVVTILIMMILTLIVIGFARLSRNEQQQALDRELNTQAFYAAETAVNDVKQKFTSGTVDVTQDYNDTCQHFVTSYALNKSVSTPNVEYSCLLVDPSPVTLSYNPVNTGTSRVFHLLAKNSGDIIDTVKFVWQPHDGTGHLQGTCNPSLDTATWLNAFPSDWPTSCKVGILRVNVLKFDAPAVRADLINNTFTGFFYPHTDGGAVSTVTYANGIGATNAGVIKSGGCTGAGVCTVTITGLGARSSYVRMRSIYRSNDVTVTATDAVGTPLELADAQAVVDATGKASGVLRRIQVRLGLSKFGASFPENALQTADSICKRYSVATPDRVVIEPILDSTTACDFN